MGAMKIIEPSVSSRDESSSHQVLIPRGERSGLWDARRGELLKLSIARSTNT
jgi:hypothetical protein